MSLQFTQSKVNKDCLFFQDDMEFLWCLVPFKDPVGEPVLSIQASYGEDWEKQGTPLASMDLTRSQAASLIEKLQEFVNTGTLTHKPAR